MSDQSQGPESFLETNVMGTYCPEAVRRYRNRLIYVSVAKSTATGHNLKKANDLTNTRSWKPNSPYGASKAAADRLCYSVLSPYGISTSRSTVRSMPSASAKRLAIRRADSAADPPGHQR